MSINKIDSRLISKNVDMMDGLSSMHECIDPILVDKNPNKVTNRFMFPNYDETKRSSMWHIIFFNSQQICKTLMGLLQSSWALECISIWLEVDNTHSHATIFGRVFQLTQKYSFTLSFCQFENIFSRFAYNCLFETNANK